MPLPKRLYAANEELGKKNDDHRPSAGAWPTLMRTWHGPRRKRILLGLVGLYLLYLFIKHLPSNVPPVSQRYDPRFQAPLHQGKPQMPKQFAPHGPPPRSHKTDAGHYYDGPIKFYELASTLGMGMSTTQNNRNVLFAASNLRSATSIISLACDMSKQNTNRVHFVLMGRDDITIDGLKEVNGIRDADCDVQWHDGRPDYAMYSSNLRMEVSARASLSHVNTFILPQTVIVDSSVREDGFFVKGINDKARELSVPVIELPLDAADSLQWIGKLESRSLRAWNDFQIEILVHAPTESSGSLIRLLNSLRAADYFGSAIPRLTIELPAHIDVPTSQFLDTFRWPPGSDPGHTRLSLRRRINPERLGVSESSLHMIETFYPAHVHSSHVLVLSSQAELSPSFYHYLKYCLLEYKYSASALATANKLLGISLELPTEHLDGKGHLSLPREDDSNRSLQLLLWQAPNSNAALYFGDKWVELHSFLSNLITTDPYLSKQGLHPKLVSERHPAWVEYLLQLTRVRGYSMLYPAFAIREGSAIITMHNELYQPPEEFLSTKSTSSDAGDPTGFASAKEDDVLTAQLETSRMEKAESSLSTTNYLLSLIFRDFLPSNDANGTYALPQIPDIPILSYDGQRLTEDASGELSASYAETFAINFGGCESGSTRSPMKLWSADDLFCLEV